MQPRRRPGRPRSRAPTLPAAAGGRSSEGGLLAALYAAQGATGRAGYLRNRLPAGLCRTGCADARRPRPGGRARPGHALEHRRNLPEGAHAAAAAIMRPSTPPPRRCGSSTGSRGAIDVKVDTDDTPPPSNRRAPPPRRSSPSRSRSPPCWWQAMRRPPAIRMAMLADERVRSLMARTSVAADAALDAGYPDRRPAWVAVTLTDGRVLRHALDHARGEPENPMSREDIARKFDQVAGPIYGAEGLRIRDSVLAAGCRACARRAGHAADARHHAHFLHAQRRTSMTAIHSGVFRILAAVRGLRHPLRQRARAGARITSSAAIRTTRHAHGLLRVAGARRRPRVRGRYRLRRGSRAQARTHAAAHAAEGLALLAWTRRRWRDVDHHPSCTTTMSALPSILSPPRGFHLQDAGDGLRQWPATCATASSTTATRWTRSPAWCASVYKRSRGYSTPASAELAPGLSVHHIGGHTAPRACNARAVCAARLMAPIRTSHFYELPRKAPRVHHGIPRWPGHRGLRHAGAPGHTRRRTRARARSVIGHVALSGRVTLELVLGISWCAAGRCRCHRIEDDAHAPSAS